MQAEAELKKKQMSARDQCVDLIEGEFSKKWESLSPEAHIFLAGLSNEDFEKQISVIKISIWVLLRQYQQVLLPKIRCTAWFQNRYVISFIKKKQKMQHLLPLIQLRESTINPKKRTSQAFASKKFSSINAAQPVLS